MPTDPVAVEPPPHAIAALTTSEITLYRGRLERAIKRLTVEASTDLRRRLAEVLAEEEDRARIRRANA